MLDFIYVCLARQKIFWQTHWSVMPGGIGEIALPGKTCHANFLSCQRNGLKIYQHLLKIRFWKSYWNPTRQKIWLTCSSTEKNLSSRIMWTTNPSHPLPPNIPIFVGEVITLTFLPVILSEKNLCIYEWPNYKI